MYALSKPCAQVFGSLKNQTILPLVRSLNFSPLLAHAHIKAKTPPETETPPEHMLCDECNAGGVSESIQGYKDMNNIQLQACVHP